jgi:hypothetical protein
LLLWRLPVQRFLSTHNAKKHAHSAKVAKTNSKKMLGANLSLSHVSLGHLPADSNFAVGGFPSLVKFTFFYNSVMYALPFHFNYSVVAC